jgi:hypothetical protein
MKPVLKTPLMLFPLRLVLLFALLGVMQGLV